jgi:L-cysteine S-thiosulfotransferase
MRRTIIYGLAVGAAVLCTAALATNAPPAAGSSDDAIAQYRAMFGDDNPAELWESRGKDMWEAARGPKHVALAAMCDLGLGAGVSVGAYARLPRYFQDTKRVEDMESRLLGCMTELQGFDRDTLLASRFGDGARRSDLEALMAYLVSQSRNAKIVLPLTHAREKEAYDVGRAIFFYRAGTHDFSCSTCHSESSKRIRLQNLPNLTEPQDAQAAYTTWPSYRVSQGELRTMEWRLADCFRQQRLPELQYGSPAAIALTMFLAKNAEGGVMHAPAIKR